MENLQIGTMVQYITSPATDRDGTQWQAQTFPATVVGRIGDKLDLVVIESGHYPSPVIITRTSNVVPYEAGKAGWRPIPTSGGVMAEFAIADDLARNLRSCAADKSAVEGENKGLRGEIGALKDERESLNVIIREQAVALAEYRKERDGWRTKFAAIKDDNAVLRAQNDGLVDAYKLREAEVIRLKGETCRACSSEIASRDVEIKTLRDDNERLVKTVNTLAKQVHDLEAANANDEATWSMRFRDLNGDHKAIVDRLTKSNENWARSYQDVCGSLSEFDKVARNMGSYNRDLLTRIDVLRQEIKDRSANATINYTCATINDTCAARAGTEDFRGSDY